MIPDTIHKTLESLGVEFAAVANLDNAEIQFFGSSGSVDDSDLIGTLFGDRETVHALDRSIEGQILPRSWNQGQVSCIVCKPTATFIVGLFIKDDLDAIQQYHWAKKANETLLSVFDPSVE